MWLLMIMKKPSRFLGKQRCKFSRNVRLKNLLLSDLSFPFVRLWSVYSTKSATCILDLVYAVLSLKCKTISLK